MTEADALEIRILDLARTYGRLMVELQRTSEVSLHDAAQEPMEKLLEAAKDLYRAEEMERRWDL